MKRFCFLLAMVLTIGANAQVGYSWLINPTYDSAGDFNDGVAIVSKGNLFGAIDTNGKEVIPVQFVELNPFAEKVTSYKRPNGKVGIIDVTGKVLCEKDYDKIFAVTDSCAKVQKGDYGFIDAFGKEIVPCKYGNLLPFSNGMTYFFYALKYGFYNTKGATVVPLTYTNVGTFADGLCPVSLKDKWGYINTAGKLVIPMEYEDAGVFSEGLACVQKNGKFGYIDREGKMVIPFKFDMQANFNNGIIEVFENNAEGESVAGYYDNTGKKLFSLQTGWWTDGPFSEDLLPVADGHYFGYLDKAGKQPFPMEFEKVSKFSDGVATVKMDGYIGVINTVGEKIVTPQFDQAGNCVDGLIPVKKDGKWGYILLSE
jgi:hypothetical protein